MHGPARDADGAAVPEEARKEAGETEDTTARKEPRETEDTEARKEAGETEDTTARKEPRETDDTEARKEAGKTEENNQAAEKEEREEKDAEAAESDGPEAAGDEAAQELPEPRREQLSALEVRAMVQELQGLVGSYLDKAYQPSRDELLLRLRTPGVGRRDLYARRGALLFLTRNPPPNPTKPGAFAMAVRRNVSGGRVFKVEQAGFDRVVTLFVQKHDGDYRIVLELFGDGNCLVVRPDGRILLPLVHEAWKTRVLRPGVPYEPPPARDDPFTFDREGFVERLRRGNREIVRALAREVGLGGPVAEEVVARSGVDKNVAVQEADEGLLDAVFDAWDSLRHEVEGDSVGGRVLVEDGRPVDVAAHRSVLMEREAEAGPGRVRVAQTGTFSDALDELFLKWRRSSQAQEESERVEKAKSKLETQRDAQEEAIVKFTRQEAEGRAHGDLLFAHYQDVERILGSIHEARRAHDWKTIEKRVEGGRASGNPDAKRIVRIEPNRGRIVVRLEDPEGVEHEVPLDITKGVTENAQDAYSRSKTARAKLAGARKALEGTRERLREAGDQAEAAAQTARETSARPSVLIGPERHHWFEGYRWMVASTGELVLGGRDAGSNDRLVKKHLQDDDRYLHADIHGAPSVVVKPVQGEVTEQALREAGVFAAVYSRAFAQAGSADAYWAMPSQVSKTPEAGEFLARGAFIVRGKRNWMRKLPMELAVGRVWLDGDGSLTEPPDEAAQEQRSRAKLMAGSVDAVKRHADQWVVVGPGKTDRREVTRALARAFDAHPDPVERVLPPGSLQVVEAHGVHLPPPGEGDGGRGGSGKEAVREKDVARKRRRGAKR